MFIAQHCDSSHDLVKKLTLYMSLNRHLHELLEVMNNNILVAHFPHASFHEALSVTKSSTSDKEITS